MGGVGRRDREHALPMDLPHLQTLIKRDPVSYRDEFLQQLQHFGAHCALFSFARSTIG